ILPVMVSMYFIVGPQMMIASHFQAVGDAPRAGLLSLAKPYLFAGPLIFGLAMVFGEVGIWLAGPIAETLLLVLTVIVLFGLQGRSSRRFGVFITTKAAS
ncbi:MAG: MATE family efflux transporter, partial [Deltaproteobacteria bacterium]